MNLEELIATKTFKEANECLKTKIAPGFYSENTFLDIDYLLDKGCIDYNGEYFCDDNCFGHIEEERYGVVVPEVTRVLGNTFECAEFEEVAFLSVQEIHEQCFFHAKINKIFLPESLKLIEPYTFHRSQIGAIYYEGSEKEFYKINMDNSEINPKIVKFDSMLSDIDFKYIKKQKDLLKICAR